MNAVFLELAPVLSIDGSSVDSLRMDHANSGQSLESGVNALDCGPTAKILRYPYGERGRSGTPYKDIEGDTTSV